MANSKLTAKGGQHNRRQATGDRRLYSRYKYSSQALRLGSFKELIICPAFAGLTSQLTNSEVNTPYFTFILNFRKNAGSGLSKKFVTSRTALAFSPVSLKRYENAAIRKVSEQVFQTFRKPLIPAFYIFSAKEFSR